MVVTVDVVQNCHPLQCLCCWPWLHSVPKAVVFPSRHLVSCGRWCFDTVTRHQRADTSPRLCTGSKYSPGIRLASSGNEMLGNSSPSRVVSYLFPHGWMGDIPLELRGLFRGRKMSAPRLYRALSQESLHESLRRPDRLDGRL